MKQAEKLARDVCRAVGHEAQGAVCDRCGELMFDIGTVLPMPGKPPKGFLPCDGRKVKRSDYMELSKVLGTNYGGDEKEFNLPQLPRGCIKAR